MTSQGVPYVSEKIHQWLKEEGYHTKQNNDPNSQFNLSAWLGEQTNTVFTIFIPKNSFDCVTVATALVLTEQDRKMFGFLKKDTQKSFLADLQYALIQMNVAFQFQPSLHDLQRITIQSPIYFDGLTKDKFFQSILLVNRTMYLANLKYRNLSELP